MSRSALVGARAAPRTSGSQPTPISGKSTRAQLRAELRLESGTNSAAEISDLRVGQGRCAALKSDAHQQRVFSGRDIFAAEKIRRLDPMDFGDPQRLNGFGHSGKLCAVGQQQ